MYSHHQAKETYATYTMTHTHALSANPGHFGCQAEYAMPVAMDAGLAPANPIV
jgi:hypothetical protein